MSDRKKKLLPQMRSDISHQRKEWIESETGKQLNMKSLVQKRRVSNLNPLRNRCDLFINQLEKKKLFNYSSLVNNKLP